MSTTNTTPEASACGGAEQSTAVKCSHCHSTNISALAEDTNEFVCRNCNRIFRYEDQEGVTLYDRNTPTGTNDDNEDDDGVMRCSRCNSTIDSDIGSLIVSPNRRVCRRCDKSLASDDAQPVHNRERDQVVIARDNETILDAILWSLSDPDLEHPEVIMLIGNPGVGKSEIVNTIHKALTGKYKVLARSGGGGAQTFTREINWYMNCGVTPHNIVDPRRRERMAPLVKKLPHILDVAGLTNDLKHKTLLEFMIGGHIPPGTSIVTLQEMDETKLRLRYPRPQSEWKVTKICYVESVSTRSMPNDLIECLQSVLKIVDPKTLCRKYHARVYLILSKWDLVIDPNERNVYAPDNNRKQDRSVNAKDATKKRDELLSLFNMIGAAESLSRRWSSFMDDTGLDNVYIEKNALEFIKLLLEQQTRAPLPPPPPPDCLTMLKLFLYNLWQFMKSFLQKANRLGSVLAVPLAILAILIVLLTKGV